MSQCQISLSIHNNVYEFDFPSQYQVSKLEIFVMNYFAEVSKYLLSHQLRLNYHNSNLLLWANKRIRDVLPLDMKIELVAEFVPIQQSMTHITESSFLAERDSQLITDVFDFSQISCDEEDQCNGQIVINGEQISDID